MLPHVTHWPSTCHLAVGFLLFAIGFWLLALIKLIASRMKFSAYEKLLTYWLAGIHPGQKIVLAIVQTPRFVVGDVDRLDDGGVLRLYRVLHVPQCVLIAQMLQLTPRIIPQGA